MGGWWLGDCEYGRFNRAQDDCSEFITSKIIDRRLNVDNYLQWRKIIKKINLTSCEKKSHLYTDLLNSKMDKWERVDAAILWSHGAEDTKFGDAYVISEGNVKLS